MEKFRSLQNSIHNKWQTASNKTLNFIVGLQEKAGGTGEGNLAVRRFVTDIGLARPSFSVVDTRERLHLLQSKGFTNEIIASLILLQALIDHSLPNLIILSWVPIISSLTDYPLATVAAYAWVAGRFTHGAVMGLVREIGYERLTAVMTLEEFGRASQIDASSAMTKAEAPWPINKLEVVNNLPVEEVSDLAIEELLPVSKLFGIDDVGSSVIDNLF